MDNSNFARAHESPVCKIGIFRNDREIMDFRVVPNAAVTQRGIDVSDILKILHRPECQPARQVRIDEKALHYAVFPSGRL